MRSLVLLKVAGIGARIMNWSLGTLVQRAPYRHRCEWVGQVAGWNNEILGCVQMDYDEWKNQKIEKRPCSRLS